MITTAFRHAMISMRQKDWNVLRKNSVSMLKNKTITPPPHTHKPLLPDLLPSPHHPILVFIWIQSPLIILFPSLISIKPQDLTCQYQHSTSHSVLKILSLPLIYHLFLIISHHTNSQYSLLNSSSSASSKIDSKLTLLLCNTQKYF